MADLLGKRVRHRLTPKGDPDVDSFRVEPVARPLNYLEIGPQIKQGRYIISSASFTIRNLATWSPPYDRQHECDSASTLDLPPVIYGGTEGGKMSADPAAPPLDEEKRPCPKKVFRRTRMSGQVRPPQPRRPPCLLEIRPAPPDTRVKRADTKRDHASAFGHLSPATLAETDFIIFGGPRRDSMKHLISC